MDQRTGTRHEQVFASTREASPPPSAVAPRRVTELRTPADHLSVRTARLLASAVGASSGADVDTVEDLRLIVNEACGVLLDSCVPGRQPDELVVTFEQDATRISVVVTRTGATLVDQPTWVSAKVLETMSTAWELDGHTVRLQLDISHPSDGAASEPGAGQTSGR